jgi:hypothetical protein
VGNSEIKRSLRTLGNGCVDNIKIDLGAIEWGNMDWIDPVEERGQWRAFGKTVKSLRVS